MTSEPQQYIMLSTIVTTVCYKIEGKKCKSSEKNQIILTVAQIIWNLEFTDQIPFLQNKYWKLFTMFVSTF